MRGHPTLLKVGAASALALGLGLLFASELKGGTIVAISTINHGVIFAAGAITLSMAFWLGKVRPARWERLTSGVDADVLITGRVERIEATPGESVPCDDEAPDFPFEQALAETLLTLSPELRHTLEYLSIEVVDSRRRGYARYTSIRDDRSQFFANRIVIFRNRVMSDFGRDSQLLKAQIAYIVHAGIAIHHGRRV